jgi:hypothetical protein
MSASAEVSVTEGGDSDADRSSTLAAEYSSARSHHVRKYSDVPQLAARLKGLPRLTSQQLTVPAVPLSPTAPDDEEDEKAPEPQRPAFDLGECLQWIAARVRMDPGTLIESMERIREQWTQLDARGRGVVPRAAVERFAWTSSDAGDKPMPAKLPQSVVDDVDALLSAAPDKSRLTFWNFTSLVLTAAGVDGAEVQRLFDSLPPALADVGRD